ncbi:ATP-dependent RNA helicase DHX30-like [Homarus americanus]|uniref:ATP-dependent RNA helicase DHX30-like n=1 Tax=Homarus americanus TaxID=6706 RepID=A0A8J5NEF8_HOMAM|nr:ATP-dependent RNA helicase DHX30-like [Homarus americanus]
MLVDLTMQESQDNTTFTRQVKTFLLTLDLIYIAGGSPKGSLHQSQKQLQQLVMADEHYVNKQKSGVLQLFPNVKSTVKNMFHNLSSNLNPMYRCDQKTSAVGRVNHQLVFQSSFTVNWPKPATFVGYGLNKKNAELSALVKAIEMLYNDNYISVNGYPITISVEEKKKLLQEWNLPPVITVPTPLLEEGLDLLQQFDKIEPLITQQSSSVSESLLSHVREDSEDEVGLGKEDLMETDEEMSQMPNNLEEKSQYKIDLLTGQEYTGNIEDLGNSGYRNRELLNKLYSKLQHQSSRDQDSVSLPMLQYKSDLQEALDKKRILIVAGDTGCGKSTQVPQMILDQWTEEGRGSECNILITQPRRISAISLAKRVARERNEKVGESVGYHVRLEYKRLRNRGGIMFCTTGMLLQNIHSNSTLEGISHVIVDEVHERSVQTDLLLILLHRLMRNHSSLRLILMSASLSTKQLQKYFGEDETTLLEVPGTLYPLTRHYLPHVLNTLGINPKRYQIEALMKPESRPIVNTDLVVAVIRAIDHSRPPGAILCFLPGWQDISLVQDRLLEHKHLGKKLWVLPLHSRLTSQSQEMIFESPPYGQRKVVLATNLAETSLTINDVVYVVDSGFHKEHRYNSKKDLTVLGNHWISRANSQQRAGRAGRVQPGEVFHLYSSDVHQDMSQYPIPEIMRIPLEHVILQCKSHCGEESVVSFLSDGLSVPSRRSVFAAVSTLKNLGMLHSEDWQDGETLTDLGRRVVQFSTPPHLSKALVYASIFRCVDAALTITAVLTSGRGIFHNSIELRSMIRETKAKADPTSDLLAILELIKEWNELEYYEDKLLFCNDNNISHRSLLFNQGIKRVYGNHLHDGLLVNKEDISSSFSSWNVNSHNKQLVLGVLLAGIGNVMHLQRGTFSKGILNSDSFVINTEQGARIDTGSECVLHQISKDTVQLSQHLLCIHLSRDDVSRRTVARDLSVMQPLSVALFAGHSLTMEEFDDGCVIRIDGKEQLSFSVDERTGRFILKLRSAVDQMVQYIIKTRGTGTSPLYLDTFCDDLVQHVSYLIENSEFNQKKKSVTENANL